MKQDGENRVGLIKSQTAYKVSQKMAEAAAARPEVVGDALNAISQRDPEVLNAVLDVMEADQLIASGAEVHVLPPGVQVLVQLGGGAETAPQTQPTARSVSDLDFRGMGPARFG
jgi:hypothetical protein